MKHLKLYENSIRNQYQIHGVEDFYKKHGNEYSNPHEPIIRSLMSKVLNDYDLNFDKVLDLAAGKGEITNILYDNNIKNVNAIDPYTFEVYQKETGNACERLSFDDIQTGKLNGRYYNTIICSFALHLADESKLPNICWNLSQICDNLVILTPHKRPEIKSEWGFELESEIKEDKVRVRIYKSIK